VASAVIWFAVLERARLTADAALTRQALHKLAEAGVQVTFLKLPCDLPAPCLTESDLDAIAARVVEHLRTIRPHPPTA